MYFFYKQIIKKFPFNPIFNFGILFSFIFFFTFLCSRLNYGPIEFVKHGKWPFELFVHQAFLPSFTKYFYLFINLLLINVYIIWRKISIYSSNWDKRKKTYRHQITEKYLSLYVEIKINISH